jgi:hypothetical protein
MENSWTSCVKSEVSHTLNEGKNNLHTIEGRKVNRIGHILHRNCLMQHITEGRKKEK